MITIAVASGFIAGSATVVQAKTEKGSVGFMTSKKTNE